MGRRLFYLDFTQSVRCPTRSLSQKHRVRFFQLGGVYERTNISCDKTDYSRIFFETNQTNLIANEHEMSCGVVLHLTGRNELLDSTPWLKESIRVRNRFIDTLNLTQVELLRRSRQQQRTEQEAEELRHLTRLTINGLAAGMRTSG